MIYPHLQEINWEKVGDTLCRLIVIRHAESTSNASNGLIRIAGRTIDVELTEKGQQQARDLAKRLMVLWPGVEGIFYSSPMRRAIQTAEGFREVLGRPEVPILKDERLHEVWYAAFEGASAAVYDEHGRRQQVELAALPSFEARMAYRLIPEMENMREVFERVTACLCEIALKHRGQTVWITTHNGPVKALFMHLAALEKGLDILYDSFDVANVGLLIVESDGQFLQLKAKDGIRSKAIL